MSAERINPVKLLITLAIDYFRWLQLLIALVVNLIFGPFKQWSLKHKLGIAAVCSLVLFAAFGATYFAKPEEFNGPASGWMFNFGGIAFLLFVVSAWCLSVTHFLGLARGAIHESTLGSQGQSQSSYTVER